MPNPLNLSDAPDLTNRAVKKVTTNGMESYVLPSLKKKTPNDLLKRSANAKINSLAKKIPLPTGPKPMVSDIAKKNNLNSLRATTPPPPVAKPPSFKKGGTVKKTGMAMVHKGEKVLTKEQQQKMKSKKKMMTSDGYMVC